MKTSTATQVSLHDNPSHESPHTVVVIDDQATSRAAITRVVRSVEANIDVHAFASPIEALEWAASNEPALVLTDYKMPHMDGIELIKRLRQTPSTQYVPIIMVTVVEERAVRQTALEAGATDFLTKPVDPDECRVRCRNLLLISRQQKLLREQCRSLETRLADTTDLLGKLVNGELDSTRQGSVSVEYEKLYELTSSVAAAEEMLSTIRTSIDEWEEQLRKPLHGRRGPSSN